MTGGMTAGKAAIVSKPVLKCIHDSLTEALDLKRCTSGLQKCPLSRSSMSFLHSLLDVRLHPKAPQFPHPGSSDSANALVSG